MKALFGLTEDKVAGTVRHWLGAIGGFVTALGFADAEAWSSAMMNVESIIGAVFALYAWGASLYAKLTKDEVSA